MSGPEFRTLDEYVYGRAEQVSALVRRVIAENPSKFTYRGTGTYIVGHRDVVVIDPGPLLDSHRDALEAALAGERVRAILITHCHADHSPLAAWLQAETGAPTIAFGPHPRPAPDDLPHEADDDDVHDQDVLGDDVDDDQDRHPDDEVIDRAPTSAGSTMEESVDHDFEPTERAADGDIVVEGAGITMTAVHTPGHTSNHTCYSLEQESALFTGDHVMGWSTTVVSPPDGDMAAYMGSLKRVAARDDVVLWPTHGPPRDDARAYVEALAEHRRQREGAILDALRAGHSTIPAIVDLLYADVRRELHKPARRSVWAHMVKLVDEGRATVEGSDRPRLSSCYHPR